MAFSGVWDGAWPEATVPGVRPPGYRKCGTSAVIHITTSSRKAR